MSKSLLTAQDLTVQFGGLVAVDGFSLDLQENQLQGLIGPNGAGKTTVFNLLTGVYKPTQGTITLDGKEIAGLKHHRIVKMGVARTFQNIRLFKGMSVLDNVRTAYDHNLHYSVASSILRLPSYWKQEEEATREAMELLRVFGLAGLATSRADNLPYGQQRKLEIARALATRPRVLLLDEPAAGMNPTETQELMETIRTVRERFQISILLIDHDMSLIMGICEAISVLDHGVLIAHGTPEEIAQNPDVIAAYLGDDETFTEVQDA